MSATIEDRRYFALRDHCRVGDRVWVGWSGEVRMAHRAPVTSRRTTIAVLI
jgi:hypothetical protein